MKFTYPVPGGTITGRFNDPSVATPSRIHGALDIAPTKQRDIVAPERGLLHAWVAIRPQEGMLWPADPFVHQRGYAFANYFYDMFGGVLVLQVPDPSTGAVSRTHVITHSYGNQLFNWRPFANVRKHWVEQPADDRFPIFAVYTDQILVSDGDVIGGVGNAGFSTGSHIHWEVHTGATWNAHRNRIDAEEFL